MNSTRDEGATPVQFNPHWDVLSTIELETVNRQDSTVQDALGNSISKALGTSDGVLVMCDFDGTLTPIADDPQVPQITDRNYHALRRLAERPDTDVAIISGRALTDLVPRVGLPDITYAGNHGLEFMQGTTVTVHPAVEAKSSDIRAAKSFLARQVNGIPGCWVEDKSLSLTVHYRQTPTELYATVEHLLSCLRERYPNQLRYVSGKKSLEIRPDIDWDKGSSVRYLTTDLPDGWQTVYIGDDTTDEDAFRALRPHDIGVVVGDGPTAASYRLDNQRLVHSFLRKIDTERPKT